MHGNRCVTNGGVLSQQYKPFIGTVSRCCPGVLFHAENYCSVLSQEITLQKGSVTMTGIPEGKLKIQIAIVLLLRLVTISYN